MAFHFNRISVIAAAVLALAMTPLHAQDKKGPNTSKKAAAAVSESASAVEAIRTANMLARYGYSAKDPMALITAARIKKEAGGSDSKAARVDGKAGAAKNKPDALSVEAILARAKELSTGRADLIAMADDVANAKGRGAINGPGTLLTVVSARAVDNFRVTFRGGEPARVLVSGDGDSDLDLYIYDENGKLVCDDTDGTDTMVCAWTPRYTGPFTIRVRNLGVANQYRIVHN